MTVYEWNGYQWKKVESFDNVVSATVTKNNYVVTFNGGDYNGHEAKVYDKNKYKLEFHPIEQ